VKYVPQKTRERDEGGVKQTKICAKGVWRGLTEDKGVCTLTEETVAEYLGNDFVAQGIRFGQESLSQFLLVPADSH
jgi:hypothetical protein